MSKYENFTNYLNGINEDEIRLSFCEIEQILGFPLPNSKEYPAWWSNSPSNSGLTRAWILTDFRSGQVDTKAEQVTFTRQQKTDDEENAEPKYVIGGRSPIFGCMKGTTLIPEGVDLTEPADPNWGRVYDENQPLISDDIDAIRNSRILNVSEKIRALSTLHVERADIAKLLGKRYQHVRNVLVDAERKAG